MAASAKDLRTFSCEFGASLAVGAVAAFTVPPTALGRIDEALITFLAIVSGAALPGMALTAAAPRPSSDSVLEAGRLGKQLEQQVRFWFGFILTGGLAAIVVLIGRALEWSLPTPRPSFVPDWIPGGGAWLVFAATTLTVLASIRIRHIADAVLDLVKLGTSAHVAQSLERQRSDHEAVAEQIRLMPQDTKRGAAMPQRERR